MGNLSLETLKNLKDQIDEVLNSDGGSFLNLKDALINFKNINTPKFNEILQTINDVEEVFSTKIVDINNNVKSNNNIIEFFSDEFSTSIEEIMSIITEAKQGYETLKEALQNNSTNIEITSTDNVFNLNAQRQNEIIGTSISLKANSLLHLKKIDPGNKMIYFLIERYFNEVTYNYKMLGMHSISPNIIADNIFNITDSIVSYNTPNFKNLQTDKTNKIYLNGNYVYETDFYFITTNVELTDFEYHNMFSDNGVVITTPGLTFIFLTIKVNFKLDYAFKFTKESFNYELIEYNYIFPMEIVKIRKINNDVESEFENLNVKYNFSDSSEYTEITEMQTSDLRLLFVDFNKLDKTKKIKFDIKFRNIANYTYINTNTEELTITEIRNIKELNINTNLDEDSKNKFLLNINGADYSFIPDKVEYKADDFLKTNLNFEYNLNASESLMLAGIQLNEVLEFNSTLVNYCVPELDFSSDYIFKPSLETGNTIFKAYNHYNGRYVGFNNLILKIRINGKENNFDVGKFEKKEFFQSFFGIGNVKITTSPVRLANKLFALSIDVNFDDSSLDFDDISIFKLEINHEAYRGDLYTNGTIKTWSDVDEALNNTSLVGGDVNINEGKSNTINFASFYVYDVSFFYQNFKQLLISCYDNNFNNMIRNEYNDDIYSLYYTISSRSSYSGKSSMSYYTKFTGENLALKGQNLPNSKFSFPVKFVLKLSDIRASTSSTNDNSYFEHDVANVMIKDQANVIFNDFSNELIPKIENILPYKSLQNEIRTKKINNKQIGIKGIFEINLIGELVKFSISDIDGVFKKIDIVTGDLITITNISLEGNTKEELMLINHHFVSGKLNFDFLYISYVNFETSYFESIIFETFDFKMINVKTEDEFIDFAFEHSMISENMERYEAVIKELNDYNPTKTVGLKIITTNKTKDDSLTLSFSSLKTNGIYFLETPISYEVDRIKIRDYEYYYEIENNLTIPTTIKFFENKFNSLKIIDQMNGVDVRETLNNALLLKDDELFKTQVIDSLLLEANEALLNKVLENVNYVNSSYSKEFTTTDIVDAAPNNEYIIEINDRNIMVGVEKFVFETIPGFTDVVIDFESDVLYDNTSIEIIENEFINNSIDIKIINPVNPYNTQVVDNIINFSLSSSLDVKVIFSKEFGVWHNYINDFVVINELDGIGSVELTEQSIIDSIYSEAYDVNNLNFILDEINEFINGANELKIAFLLPQNSIIEGMNIESVLIGAYEPLILGIDYTYRIEQNSLKVTLSDNYNSVYKNIRINLMK